MIRKAKVKTVVPSVIATGVQIKGDITGEGAFEISGVLDGSLKCVSVTIKKDGVVNGNITADKVEIFGEVNGDVKARKIICGASAKVVGNILHQQVHIENGAYIDGNCRKVVSKQPSDAEDSNVSSLSDAKVS